MSVESKLFIIFNMFSVENPREYKELSFFFINSGGKKLLLFISENCFAKKRIKNFSFFYKISHKFVFMKY